VGSGEWRVGSADARQPCSVALPHFAQATTVACARLLALAADVAGEGFLHEVGFAAMVLFEFDEEFFHVGAGGIDFGFLGGGKMLQAEEEFVERFFELIVVAEEGLHFFGQGRHLFDGVGHVAVVLFERHEAF
jgi:hypothetical protein